MSNHLILLASAEATPSADAGLGPGVSTAHLVPFQCRIWS